MNCLTLFLGICLVQNLLNIFTVRFQWTEVFRTYFASNLPRISETPKNISVLMIIERGVIQTEHLLATAINRWRYLLHANRVALISAVVLHIALTDFQRSDISKRKIGHLEYLDLYGLLYRFIISWTRIIVGGQALFDLIYNFDVFIGFIFLFGFRE